MVRKTTRIAARKRTIIERLTAGDAVAQAARAAGISRAEAYTWKNEDTEFSAAWDDAVEEGIDMLETVAYRRAIEGSDGLLTLYLKCRRSERWNPERQLANNTLSVQVTTFYDAMSRIERLGLPVPLIEYDEFEEDNK
jgi:hypothetical protein